MADTDIRINDITLRKIKKPGKPANYMLADIDFQVGGNRFFITKAVFNVENIREALPAIKKEVGSYLVKKIFEGYDAIDALS